MQEGASHMRLCRFHHGICRPLPHGGLLVNGGCCLTDAQAGVAETGVREKGGGEMEGLFGQLKQQRFEDPGFVKFLFGSPLMGVAWFFVRLYLGWQWLA